MQIILTKDVPHIGKRGEIKNVKIGFFSNYLAPQKLAMVATASKLKETEKIRAQAVLKAKEIKAKAQEIAEKLKGLVLNFSKKVTSKQKLYGSIGEKEIIEAIKEKAKIELSKENIELPEHLKQTGEYSISIKLDEETKTTVKVIIEEKKEK